MTKDEQAIKALQGWLEANGPLTVDVPAYREELRYSIDAMAVVMWLAVAFGGCYGLWLKGLPGPLIFPVGLFPSVLAGLGLAALTTYLKDEVSWAVVRRQHEVQEKKLLVKDNGQLYIPDAGTVYSIAYLAERIPIDLLIQAMDKVDTNKALAVSKVDAQADKLLAYMQKVEL